MNLRIYLIVEEGADRVYVQTTYPIWYKKPVDRQAMILAVDIPIFGVEREPDGVVKVSSHQVHVRERLEPAAPRESEPPYWGIRIRWGDEPWVWGSKGMTESAARGAACRSNAMDSGYLYEAAMVPQAERDQSYPAWVCPKTKRACLDRRPPGPVAASETWGCPSTAAGHCSSFQAVPPPAPAGGRYVGRDWEPPDT